MKNRPRFPKYMFEDSLPTQSNENFDLKQLESIKSFKARVEYCNKTLKRLGSGSSRVVYELQDNTVLKLAKNPKGIAQNASENDGFVQSNYDIVAKVLDSHADDIWIKAEKATKITPTKFKQLSGGLPLVELWRLLSFWHAERNNKRSSIARIENYDEILETNEFVQELTDLMGNMDMPVGDFGRISTYGEIKGKLVITDYGLSQTVQSDFY